ncbi:MAG: YbaB/EbfC family nucleoid-associated protein, partial [Candidatus Omnitrophica bacterium]|nr:YbaB/EbfC family nucleoid-associated protein [Candidatus Omnitrophota bacterium]
MLDQVKKLMEMKKQADLLKKELEATVIEVQETRGIKLVVNGAQLFQSLEIDESLLTPANKN